MFPTISDIDKLDANCSDNADADADSGDNVAIDVEPDADAATDAMAAVATDWSMIVGVVESGLNASDDADADADADDDDEVPDKKTDSDETADGDNCMRVA